MRYLDDRGQYLLYTLAGIWLASSAFTFIMSQVNFAVAGGFRHGPGTVESAEKGPDKRLAGAKCQAATGDWQFVCTRDVTNPQGVSIKQRIVVPRHPYRPEIVIPNDGPVPTAAEVTAFSHADSRFSKLVDLNSASEEEIKRLPGIDKVLARRIVVAALAKPFATVEDVLRVEGMTEKRLNTIRLRVRIGSEGQPKLEQFMAARVDAGNDPAKSIRP